METGGTILFCEDDDSVRSVTRRIIERAGFRVHAAANAAAAIEMVDGLGPAVDVLITDVVMPGMSGPELAMTLREKDPGLKVLFVSGFTAEHAKVVEGFGPGAVFLPKPYTSSALIYTIEKLLFR